MRTLDRNFSETYLSLNRIMMHYKRAWRRYTRIVTRRVTMAANLMSNVSSSISFSFSPQQKLHHHDFPTTTMIEEMSTFVIEETIIMTMSTFAIEETMRMRVRTRTRTRTAKFSHSSHPLSAFWICQ